METSREYVLAVDDDPRNLDIIQEILEDYYEVETAESGEEALEMIAQRPPDILLLDIMMSGIDGYDVSRKIRKMELAIPPKIILVTGKAMLEERIKGYQAGTDDYVTKPFNDDEFLAKVNVFARLIRAEKELLKINSNLEEQVNIRTKQLLKAEKMAALGTHVAEIVHNLKNPLTIIKSSGTILSKKYSDDKNIDRINRACEKLHAIIKSILISSSTDDEMRETEIDLNTLILSELELLKGNPLLTADIHLHTELAKELPKFKAIPTHFSQILTNLCGNALDALYEINENKKLTITTESNDSKIILHVEDNGPGIPPENLEKIFDPFFSTKPIEAEDDQPTGTGLGLPSVKKMIESYGGGISLKSELGKGTRFTIKFPIKG